MKKMLFLIFLLNILSFSYAQTNFEDLSNTSINSDIEMTMFLKKLENKNLNLPPYLHPKQIAEFKEDTVVVLKIKNNTLVEKIAPLKALGLTEQEVILLLDDTKGAACSDKHSHGDLGNSWCHAAVVKTAYAILINKGVSPLLAGLLSTSIFVIKENYFDKHARDADIVTPEITILNSDRNHVAITIFADNTVYLITTTKFK